MSLDWLAWSNPVAIWWGVLVLVSLANVALWVCLCRQFRRDGQFLASIRGGLEPMLVLCAAYVLGCAFRAVLPRADVQRICLFDTWLSSVAVGRSVATVAEISFAVQWAIVLGLLGGIVKSDTVKNLAKAIVPLIVLAEFCSWYAVITTDYLANAIENSLWAIAFSCIALALARLLEEFRDRMRAALSVALVGVIAYLVFLVAIDVPMYIGRWQFDLASGKPLLDMLAGLYDAATYWKVTRDFAQWKDEIAWMSLYFSGAVWSSLALSSIYLMREHVPRWLAAPSASRWVAALIGSALGPR